MATIASYLRPRLLCNLCGCERADHILVGAPGEGKCLGQPGIMPECDCTASPEDREYFEEACE